MTSISPTPSKPLPVRWFLVGIIVLALVNYTYLILRTGGALSEQDTYAITVTTFAAKSAESILEAPRPYTHGMNYTSLLVTLSELSGVSVETFQLFILPLMVAVTMPIVAFIAYRELSRSSLIGLLGTFLLFLQPDFLWVTWRGSHEKITWSIVLTLFFVLARTFRLHRQLRNLFVYILVFYMLALGLINTNMFFSSSFIVMVAITFVSGRVLIAIIERRRAGKTSTETQAGSRLLLDMHLHRLIYVVIICLLFVYTTLFYLYPPARQGLFAYTGTIDRVGALVFNVEPTAEVAEAPTINPYSYVSDTWLHPMIFLALTLFNWTVLGVGAIVWLVTMWQFWRRKLDVQQNDGLLLMCLAYSAFSFQVAASIVADLAGSFGANMQVRLFTPVMLFAIPLSAYGVVSFWRFAQPRLPRIVRTVLLAMAVIVVAYFEFAALSKAVNEPFLSNRWLFLVEPEQVTADWLKTYAPAGSVWTGIDERYRSDLNTVSELIADDTMRVYFGSRLNTDYIIWSEVERARWIRLGQYMPNLQLDSRNRVYDNGTSQIYRRPAVTVYQD